MPGILLIIFSALMLGIARLPVYCGWLGFLTLIPLLYYFDNGIKNIRILFRDAFVFSAINLTLWMHWIWGVTSGGFVGIISLYTVYYFITFILLQFIWSRLPKFKYPGFIMIFMSLEYLQNFGELRFPWTSLGYTIADYTILLQAADLGGVSLISLLLMIINVSVYLVIKRQKRYLAVIGIVFILWFGYGYWCMSTMQLTQSEEHISIMQPSIPQEEKWESKHFSELYDRYKELTRKAKEDSTRLFIWPEAAMPAYILRDPAYLSLVQNLCDEYRINIFTGFPDVLPAPSGYPGGAYYYNAASLFKPYTRYEDPYYKIAVIPVAERMPFLNIIPFLWKLQFGQANWEAGSNCRYYSSNNVTFSPQICYEMAFSQLNRKMAFRNLGENRPGKPEKIDFLVDITNDAWFGRSAGPWIHGVMTKYRAIENRIQIYRSANTGISMVVDPLGRLISKTKLFDITMVSNSLYKSSKTPLYYWICGWEWIICFLTFLLLVLAVLKRKNSILKPRGKL